MTFPTPRLTASPNANRQTGAARKTQIAYLQDDFERSLPYCAASSSAMIRSQVLTTSR